MRFKVLSITLALVFMISNSFGQAPGIIWQRCMGDENYQEASTVKTTSDGGFITLNYGSPRPNVCESGFTVSKFTETGVLEWEKCMVDISSSNLIKSVVQLPDGGFAFVTITENPKLVRLDKNGNIVLTKVFGGTGFDYINFIQLTKDGNLIGAGLTNSINGDLAGVNPTASNKGWLIKFDFNGQIIWQKCIGDDVSRFYSFNSVRETKDGGFIISGNGRYDSPPWGLMGDAILIKTDDKGNSLWEKHYGGAGADGGVMTLELSDGNYVLVGRLNSNDAGINPFHGYEDAMVVKVSTAGNTIWSKALGGKSYDQIYSLIENKNKELVLVGNTFSSDGDVIGNDKIKDKAHLWVVCMSTSDATINWQRVYGGNSDLASETANDVVQMANGSYIVVGGTTSNDGDVVGNHGDRDCWLINMGPYNTVIGNVFIDQNSNGQKDAGEIYLNIATVNAEKTGLYTNTVIPAPGGNYKIGIDTGKVSLYAKTYFPYYNLVPVSKLINRNTYFNYDTVNFALQPMAGKRDLQVTVIPITPARPGMNPTYRILYKNVGTDTVPNVKLTFVKDARQTLVSTVPSPASTNQDTVTWNRTGLKPLDTGSVILVLKLGIPPVVNLNDTIQLSAMVGPVAGDITPADDTIRLKQIVVSSYDPNDKTEVNAGSITARQVAQAEWLSYLIRFQNTGTDTAFNIRITDTLDTRLDWNSLQIVETSHASTLEVKEGNKLTWNFNNILLPDSVHNEPLSHGYILYRIKPKTTLAIGDVIRNTASIYFDFNKPVITNEQLTTVRFTPVAKPVVTGIQSLYCSNQGVQKGKLSNNPPSNGDVSVKATLDVTSIPVAADSTFKLDIAVLPAGAHRLSIVYKDASSSDSVVYSFTVSAVVTPDVNVNSNINTVSNLSDAVVVTAVNAAGGGANPLYTFSKDRNMVNILQSESAANVLTIQPAALSTGDNWIYVRMKSSATCYSVQTNVDSVKIERVTVTGITDADYPNQVIKIYPNPFNRIINISGLSAGKAYTFTIRNLQGQQVYSKEVKNVNSYTIDRPGLSGSQFWLSIYDNSKKKQIGTVPLIKE